MEFHCLTTIGISFLLIFTLPPTSSAERGLPCTHPLRISYPQYFPHCGQQPCTYTSWSSWQMVPNSVVSVPTSQCPSGRSFREERTRTALGSGCTGPLNGIQDICLPTQEERLIDALGLGSVSGLVNVEILTSARIDSSASIGNKITLSAPTDLPGPPGPPPSSTSAPSTLREKRQLVRGCKESHRICRNLPDIRKRSIRRTPKESPIHNHINPIRTDLNPIPFDWLEHGTHFRGKRQTKCGGSGDEQFVLFVLDTSGSIGPENFERMKNATSKLLPLFCRQVKFAVITFSSYVNLEFCFNCHASTFNGRSRASRAIRNIVFRSGATRTGATARCVCDHLLQPSCGISSTPSCLDVVFITDGQSNDPTLEICDEIMCLHRQFGIDTYAIGIGNYNHLELDCITNYSDLISAFEFDNFVEFEKAIDNIAQRLFSSVLNKNLESCARLDKSISPTGVPPSRK